MLNLTKNLKMQMNNQEDKTMKFGYGEKDTLNTYMSGIDKFLAIAVIKDNRGESSLDAIMAAKEMLLEMKDYMSKNEEFDSKTETKTETFAEHCLRESAVEKKIKKQEE